MQAIGKEAKKIESNIATLQNHYEQHVHPGVLWDVEVCAQPGRVYDAKGNQVRCFWEAEVYAECVCVYMAAAVHRSLAWRLPDLSSKQGSFIEHTLCSLHKNTFMVLSFYLTVSSLAISAPSLQANPVYQALVLSQRMLTNNFRNVGLFWIRLVMYVSVCFVAALQPYVVILILSIVAMVDCVTRNMHL